MENKQDLPLDDDPLKEIRALRERLGINQPYVYRPKPLVSVDILQGAFPDRDLTDKEVLIKTRREYDVNESLRKIADSGVANVNELLKTALELQVAGKQDEFMKNLKNKDEEQS